MLANKQSGAALLAFLLIIVTGASYMLVRELNANIRRVQSGPETATALSEAKNALLGWAINHPINPGTLPFPDRIEASNPNYDGDIDCVTTAVANTHLIGKFPWRDIQSTCKDAGSLSGLQTNVFDVNGERLLYAVSKNLVYETPDYPEISLSMLDRTTDWITVRDKNGGVLSDKVAFVVIASGSATGSQDRSAATPTTANYLDSVTIGGTCTGGTVTGGTTYSNSDTDQDFIIYPNSDLTADECDSFNDQLVFVTIDDLMDSLKKRVLSEISNVFSAYHNDYGALPWLSPYFDPKADNRILYGTHTGSDNASSLTDSTADFKDSGVKKGDIVRNVTDGSFSIVTVDNTDTTLTVTGIHLGTGNDFDTDDEYYIVPKDLGNKLDDKADISSSGSSLVDDNQVFQKLDVVPGDIIDNITDSSSGVVDTVSDTTITVRDLTGGTDNDFDDDDEYQVRSYAGKATTTNANPLILDDDHKNFDVMGVSAGDVIVNLKDGSIGRVSTVTQTSLTAASLNFGRENDFEDNDTYILPRFVGIDSTREGLLSFHRPGGYFPSAFTVDWNIPELISAAANATLSTNTSATHTNYVTSLEQYVQTSSGTSGTITVGISDGTCIWTLPEIAECYGEYTDTNFLRGRSTTGTSGTTVIDSGTDFPAAGIKRGDKLANISDGTNGVVSSTSGTNTIVGASITGLTAIDFSAGEGYKVNVATSFSFNTGPESHTLLSGNTFTITELGGIPAAASVGDAIENVDATFGGGIGTITDITGNVITATGLVGGPVTDIFTNEDYIIHYNYVDKRTYAFQTRFSGTTNTSNSNGKRVQDICLGYTACAGSASNVSLPFHNMGSSGTADSADNSSPFTLEDNPGAGVPNFDHLRIRKDYVVANTTDGSNGIITTYIDNHNVSIDDLNDGTNNDFSSGDSYYITAPVVSIKDYDASDNELSNAAISIPSGGAQGSIKIAGIDYYLHPLDIDLNDDGDYNDSGDVEPDIPAWFIRNKWHQYVYIAYSAGEQPGVGTACTAGTDCLVLNIGTNTTNNIRAMVMLSGEELSDQAWTGGSIGNYVDLTENSDADDIFEKQSVSSSFNDNIRVAVSCPSDTTKLCWSE
jgi:hypothetical protein